MNFHSAQAFYDAATPEDYATNGWVWEGADEDTDEDTEDDATNHDYAPCRGCRARGPKCDRCDG